MLDPSTGEIVKRDYALSVLTGAEALVEEARSVADRKHWEQ